MNENAETILPGRGKAMMEMIVERLADLSISPEAEAEALAIVKSAATPGFDPAKLYAEWRSDVLASGDGEFDEARVDPSQSYLTWLAERVADPYRISFRAVQAFTKGRDVEGVNEFVHLRWGQELAWGHRLRASPDDRVAFLSSLFLRQVAFNGYKAFIDVAEAFESATADFAFASATEHRMTPKAIRLGTDETAYRPAFLRLYEVRFSSQLDAMLPEQLMASAAKARQAQATDRNLYLSVSALKAARESRLSRLLSVIKVGMDTLRSPDQLVAAETTFLEAMSRGEVELASGGLPHLEFIRWLRATEPVVVPPERAFDPGYPRILGAPGHWADRLSRDFHEIGARDRDTLSSWLSPIVSRARSIPMDCVTDYGYHLLRREG